MSAAESRQRMIEKVVVPQLLMRFPNPPGEFLEEGAVMLRGMDDQVMSDAWRAMELVDYIARVDGIGHKRRWRLTDEGRRERMKYLRQFGVRS